MSPVMSPSRAIKKKCPPKVPAITSNVNSSTSKTKNSYFIPPPRIPGGVPTLGTYESVKNVEYTDSSVVCDEERADYENNVATDDSHCSSTSSVDEVVIDASDSPAEVTKCKDRAFVTLRSEIKGNKWCEASIKR